MESCFHESHEGMDVNGQHHAPVAFPTDNHLVELLEQETRWTPRCCGRFGEINYPCHRLETETRIPDRTSCRLVIRPNMLLCRRTLKLISFYNFKTKYSVGRT